jgi:G:T-mismatch repair DNA endonuclease (very short patch repair protein)
MGNKLTIDKNRVLKEYLRGKSSLILSKEFGVSKPTILKILKEYNVTRKRDRCTSLKITESDGSYVVERICPTCKKTILTKSKDKVIACRNHFNKVKENSRCKKCSLELQIGEGNPFYGKKHSKKTKNQISKSREGKGMGESNGMSNDEHREKSAKMIRQKWKNGEMEHVRKIMSDKMKETRRLGKIKSVVRSKKEKEILLEIKKLGYEVKHSLRVDTKICDIYLPKYNLIIEYNGDYWHCNPKKYGEDYFNQVKGKTAKELWEYDKNKVDLIIKRGYNLEIIWESDLKDDPDLINKILKKYDNGK